jgi:hypothetical protein
VHAAKHFRQGGLRASRIDAFVMDYGEWLGTTTTSASGTSDDTRSKGSGANNAEAYPRGPSRRPAEVDAALLRGLPDDALSWSRSQARKLAVGESGRGNERGGGGAVGIDVAGRSYDPFDALLLPSDLLPAVAEASDATRSGRMWGRAVADACGVAWREALYGEYRGHARLVAQFVVASQALQGLAQAAGELVPRDVPDSAWWSCVASSASQLFVMALCTAVLLWTQPHRTRQNFDAEILPTALQAGICAPVFVLAVRRWTPNRVIVAGLEIALDFSAMLQPAMGISLALYETASELDITAVIAALRAKRTLPQQ